MWETWVRSLGWEDPWRRKWQPTLVLLPGESHGGKSLVGYSPRGRKQLDTTELLHFTFFLYEKPNFIIIIIFTVLENILVNAYL